MVLVKMWWWRWWFLSFCTCTFSTAVGGGSADADDATSGMAYNKRRNVREMEEEGNILGRLPRCSVDRL